MKKRTFLSKLQRNGVYCIAGALVVLLGVPLYQLLILVPAGYSNALNAPGQTLRWINTHSALFLGYRALPVIGFALMISLPFTLFRIIVAQEVLGREEEVEEDEAKAAQEKQDAAGTGETDGIPAFTWRGKGYAVLGAWTGLPGLLLFAIGTLVSSLYLVSIAASFSSRASIPDSAAPLASVFAILTNTAGIGLLGLSCFFFGMVIARSGIKLWPGLWVAFGYVAIAIGLLLCASAVEVALAPYAGQAPLSTPAILFFALWVLWFGIMLARLKPE